MKAFVTVSSVIATGVFAGASLFITLQIFFLLELANLSALQELGLEYDHTQKALNMIVWAAIFAALAVISAFRTIWLMRRTSPARK